MQSFESSRSLAEDGILQYLTSRLEVDHPVFLEFGVQDFAEANTRPLLQKDNWSGLVLDASQENIERVRNAFLHPDTWGQAPANGRPAAQVWPRPAESFPVANDSEGLGSRSA